MQRCGIFAKELPTQRHRGTEKNEKRLETNDISCDLLTLSVCLCTSVFSFFTASRLGSHSNERTQIGRRARKHHKVAPQVFAGRRSKDFRSRPVNLFGYRYGKTEKSNHGISFPLSPTLVRSSEGACIANTRVTGDSVRFRAFSGVQNRIKFYQILPILTKNVQRTGSNRHLPGAF